MLSTLAPQLQLAVKGLSSAPRVLPPRGLPELGRDLRSSKAPQTQHLLLKHSEAFQQKQKTRPSSLMGCCWKTMRHNAVKSFLPKRSSVKASTFLNHYAIFSFHIS